MVVAGNHLLFGRHDRGAVPGIIGRPRTTVVISAIGLVLLLGVGQVLIPAYAASGAAMTFSIARPRITACNCR